MKNTSLLSKLAAVITSRKKHKLRATARALPQSAADGSEPEPSTSLSGAFFVVLILHVFVVVGIYAFNSIKASRRSQEKSAAQLAPLAPATKPPSTATVKNAAPAATGAATTRPAEKPVPAAAATGTAVPRPAAGKEHQIKPGDTATKIANLHNLKTDELLAANNLKPTDVLHPGRTLTIPAAKTATTPKTAATKPVNVAPTKTTPGVHVVKKGDTATSIAKKYGLTADDLIKINKISDAKKIQEGRALVIPKKKG